MKCVAVGAHFSTPGLFEPAKSPDDRVDYPLLGLQFSSPCEHQVLTFTVVWTWSHPSVDSGSELGHMAMMINFLG